MQQDIRISTLLLAMTVSMAFVGSAGCLGGGDSGEVTLDLGDIRAKGGYVEIETTVSGPEDTYTVNLSAPDGNISDTGYVTGDNMSGGSQTLWLKMGGLNENPASGQYQVTVKEYSGEEVLAQGTSEYSGPSLQIEGAEFTWTQEESKYVSDNGSVTLSSMGDPGLIASVSVQMGGNTSTVDFTFKGIAQSVDSDESLTLSSPDFILVLDSGSYQATVEILDNGGSIMTSDSVQVQVP
ncbi:MAG: hypothetical protein ACLFS6_09610 [Methanomassiliicoccales archaeon]